ncbi:MAG: hypothetical protein JXR58_08010 [Bacteroidales bacterium]|nr:hypothetical protein [Bacteroidales bacterium]
MRQIKTYLPEIYQNLFPEFFYKEIKKETIATCDNCIMLEGNNPIKNMSFYLKETKCCTFFPFIPNYMVGLILKEGSEYGQAAVRKLISERVGISPKGISPGKKYQLDFELSREKGFGQNLSLKCPFLDSDVDCSIWEARGAVCATYFCRNVCGYDGEQFWHSVKNYLSAAEQKLARYAILETDKNLAITKNKPDNRFCFSADEIDQTQSPDYETIWGKWLGREEIFFQYCYEKIEKLNAESFEKLMGIENDFLFVSLEKSYEEMMFPILPDRLMLNPEATFTRESNSFILNVYSGSFNISDVFFEVLNCFTGEFNVAETISNIGENPGIEIDEELLVNLYQNRVLIGC